MPIESEIKFVISLPKLCSLLDFQKLEFSEIEQHYFSSELIRKKLFPEIAHLLDFKDMPETSKNGRVRATTCHGVTTYSLTVKAPRENKLSRLELEISIPEKTYQEFIKLSDYGSLKKRRYVVPGKVGKSKLNAEIDVYYEFAGKNLQTNLSGASRYPYAVIEIEFEKNAELEAIRNGDHDYFFLKEAKELFNLPIEIQDLFKNTYLARNGIAEGISADLLV